MRGPGSSSAARFAGILCVFVVLGVSVANASGPGPSLRGQLRTLRSRTHASLLDLYAIDAQLDRVHAQLTTLQTEVGQIRRQQVTLARELAATRHTLVVSRTELAINLRVLYKQDDVSALAVVLGSRSLDAAMSKLDALSSVADQSEQMLATTKAAQRQLGSLRATLVSRRERLDADVDEALRAADALTGARNARASFISRLRRSTRLKAAQLAALEAAAARVERKSEQIQAAAPEPVSAPTPVVQTAASPQPGGRTITVSSTGYSLQGHTATGLPVGYGVVAVDPSVIPLGTRLAVPGYGEGVAADTGGAVRGDTIDLWFPTLAQARAWGRRTVTITLH
ncbi:MAG TPA: 3D domain-containing protein [Gaiellaceae bacterium]|nr:3D domain-containing protein [Gaiellaceae bacterium]